MGSIDPNRDPRPLLLRKVFVSANENVNAVETPATKLQISPWSTPVLARDVVLKCNNTPSMPIRKAAKIVRSVSSDVEIKGDVARPSEGRASFELESSQFCLTEPDPDELIIVGLGLRDMKGGGRAKITVAREAYPTAILARDEALVIPRLSLAV